MPAPVVPGQSAPASGPGLPPGVAPSIAPGPSPTSAGAPTGVVPAGIAGFPGGVPQPSPTAAAAPAMSPSMPIPVTSATPLPSNLPAGGLQTPPRAPHGGNEEVGVKKVQEKQRFLVV